MLSKEGGRRTTRTRLLAAAYDLLVEEGYQSTTLQGVARRAGLSTGAIYCHFVNKQELMALAVLDRWTQAQEDAAAAARADSGDDRPHHVLAVHIAQHLTAPPEPVHQLLTEVTGAVLRDGGDAASPLLGSIQMLAWVIRSTLERAMVDGAVDDRLDADALTSVILNLYLGTITAKAWGLEQPGFEETVTVLAAVNRGLAPPPSSGPAAAAAADRQPVPDVTVDGSA